MPPNESGSELPIKTNRILVTGGGGFLGKAIVRRLVQQGHEVRSLARSLHPELQALDVTQVQGDIYRPTDVARACDGVEAIFHVAAKAGIWGSYKSFYNTNFLGTINVLEACRTHNISHLIYTSSPSVVFDGRHMENADETAPYPATYKAYYPRTKALAEQAVVRAARQGLSSIILRPHLIWGPEDNHLVPRILKRGRKLARIGNLNPLVDTVYIDNAADAHVRALQHLQQNPSLSGKIYFISQGQPIPLWDMVSGILRAGGQSPVKRSVPYSLAWGVGAVMELLYQVLPLKGEPPMTRFLAEELSTAHWFNIDAAKQDLDYKPYISIDEGLQRLRDWLAGNPYHL
jgi:nucleoside-diphosphate-sugar epimerase